jgi:hypothetical protein
MGIHLSKKKRKTYIFIKLLNQDETKDKTIRRHNNTKNIYQLMVEKISL